MGKILEKLGLQSKELKLNRADRRAKMKVRRKHRGFTKPLTK